MSRTTVEQIKERLPIDVVVGQYVKLEKAGKSLKARCPFHNEKTGSFFVSPERGGYYCFGCGAKGDIFSFVEQFEGLDFRGALKLLAERAGVPLVYDQKSDGERDRLFQIMEEAAKFFEIQFDKSKEAQEYVKSRGINEETRKLFRIGWAPEGWRNLGVYLKGKGWSEAMMEKAGLVKRKDTGSTEQGLRMSDAKGTELSHGRELSSRLEIARQDEPRADIGEESLRAGITKNMRSTPLPEGEPFPTSVGVGEGLAQGKGGVTNNSYDRFRGRIMFPIFDSSGRIIAFSGRILKEDEKSAKYLNSPDTPLYDKSLVLYGLDKAKGEIRRLGYSVLVEGQMDLVMSHQAGIKNTVAASGTALTDESFSANGAVSNLGLVRRLSPNIIVAFDSDPAGRKAALRAAGIALSMGMDVKIADIAGGKDPADLVKENVELWKHTLRDAKPIVEFELMNVLRDTPDARKVPRALRERVFPFLARIDSEMDKSHFVKMISEKAKIADDAVWQDLRTVERTIKTAEGGSGMKSTPRPEGGREPSTASSGDDDVSRRVLFVGVNRLDLVERRLFGLLRAMETANIPEAQEHREFIKNLIGTSYEERFKQTESIMDDLVFEAEAIFGTSPEDQAKWGKHMKELVLNFEEDLINAQLIATLQELKAAERAGKTELVGEFAKKCQELSARKAEVGKSRRK